MTIASNDTIGEIRIPKIQLSRNVPVSDNFRAEMDLWLRDFFGTITISEALETHIDAVMHAFSVPIRFIAPEITRSVCEVKSRIEEFNWRVNDSPL